MIEQIPHTIGNYIFPLKCGFSIGYGIDQKYQPIWVSVLASDLIQASTVLLIKEILTIQNNFQMEF